MGKQHHDIGHQKRVKQRREKHRLAELRAESAPRFIRRKKAGTP